MKKILFCLLLSFLSLTSIAQKGKDEYAQVDKVALQIEEEQTRSTQTIADYININFTSQSDKARAIFIWVARNVQYDLANMFAIDFYAKKEEIIDRTIKTRKGICQGYAEVFHDLCQKTGLTSCVVEGYTQQNGFVDFIPHAWCAAMIDGEWYLFDPTWGSGYVQNGKFVKQVDNTFFKVKPATLISSHMPFDPLWQFLHYPVTNQEFFEGNTTINKSKPSFHYQDTLAVFERLGSLEKVIAAARRVEANGVNHNLVFNRLHYYKREIEIIRQNQAADLYNGAGASYNEGINLFNKFIDYRNKQFTPKKPDPEIQEMLDASKVKFDHSKKLVAAISSYQDQNVNALITSLAKSVEEAMGQVNEQQTFLTKYFSSSKLLRKSLFYKYTWMGIPLH